MTTSRQAVLESVLARRDAHRRRSLAFRVAAALFGVTLVLVALPLLIVLPEAGVPLLLWGLSVLAMEFDWAARAFAAVTWYWRRFHAWFSAQSLLVKGVVVVATLAVAIGLLAVVFLH